ncbi:IWS1-like protein, putative [Plasmodium gaboni]|uniref:IWS1-like protein, putative n=1 Tax=Plasmodium gaboni TaxID=647221 RepID=A0ABY1UPF7_9APIC|nr:IWS1-like protein, putative [Plasmodium gaboni]
MSSDSNKNAHESLENSGLFNDENASDGNDVENFKKKMKMIKVLNVKKNKEIKKDGKDKKKRKLQRIIDDENEDEGDAIEKENVQGDDEEGAFLFGNDDLVEEDEERHKKKRKKEKEEKDKHKKKKSIKSIIENDDKDKIHSDDSNYNDDNKKNNSNNDNNNDNNISDGDDNNNSDSSYDNSMSDHSDIKKKTKKKKKKKKSEFIDTIAEEGDEDEKEEDEDYDDENNINIDKMTSENKKSKNINFDKLGLGDDDEDEDNYMNDFGNTSNISEKKKKSHFDEILENLKSKRKRVHKISEDDGLNYCENILNQMILMHEQDIQNMKEKKPATAKLEIIDNVCKILTKPKWKPFFMKLNIYHVLALWLMPTSKNTLPNFTIRTNLLKVIQQLPITIKSLRGSQLGKIMTYLHSHKHETEENKKLIKNIMQNWMGPIIGINTNYKQYLKERQKRISENPEYHKKVLEKAKTLIPDSICIEKEEEQNEMKRHATIPYNSECSFLINVPSSIPSTSKKIIPKSKIKRLTDNMKLLKRCKKMQKVSIEGKGVAVAP